VTTRGVFPLETPPRARSRAWTARKRDAKAALPLPVRGDLVSFSFSSGIGGPLRVPATEGSASPPFSITWAKKCSLSLHRPPVTVVFEPPPPFSHCHERGFFFPFPLPCGFGTRAENVGPLFPGLDGACPGVFSFMRRDFCGPRFLLTESRNDSRDAVPFFDP